VFASLRNPYQKNVFNFSISDVAASKQIKTINSQTEQIEKKKKKKEEEEEEEEEVVVRHKIFVFILSTTFV